MSDNGKIINLADAMTPGREILQACGEMLEAICRQYPRAAGHVMAGVVVTVDAGPVRLQIEGGKAPAANGLIVPGGR